LIDEKRSTMSAKYAFGKTVTSGFEQTLERVT